MNRTLIAIAMLSTMLLASAQERLSREEALVYANAVSPYARQAGATPIATDVDVLKPAAVKEEDYIGMLLPQTNLKEETITQAGTTPVPVGQLWLHKLTPMQDDSGIPSEKLRLITVQHEGGETTVPECSLGARRSSSGALELLVFGKDKEPLLTLPLKKVQSKQELPLDISAERAEDQGIVTVKILGKYEAKLRVTALEL